MNRTYMNSFQNYTTLLYPNERSLGLLKEGEEQYHRYGSLDSLQLLIDNNQKIVYFPLLVSRMSPKLQLFHKDYEYHQLQA